MSQTRQLHPDDDDDDNNIDIDDDDDDDGGESQQHADSTSVISADDDERKRSYFVSLEKAQQRSQLELLIATKDPSVEIIKQDKQTKSDVWSNDQYRMIYRDGVRQNFALCTECQALITHKSCYGTGGLLRHRCFRKRNGLMQTHGRGRRTRKSGGFGIGQARSLADGEGGGVGGGVAVRRRRRSSRQRYAAGGIASSSAAGQSQAQTAEGNNTNASTASSCSSSTFSTARRNESFTPTASANDPTSAVLATTTTTPAAPPAEDTLTQIRYELETLIQHSDASVELLKPPAGSRSLVWTYNLLQLVYRDGERQDFVYCEECHQLLVHRVQAGTSRLLRHHCVQARIKRIELAKMDQQQQQQQQRQQQVETVAQAEEEPNTFISPFMPAGGGANVERVTGIDADKKTIAKLQLQLMSREFIPLAVLDGNSNINGNNNNNETVAAATATSAYRRLLRCLLGSAVSFGRYNPTQCWLNADDVRQRLGQRQAQLAQQLHRIVATEKLAFSCDVWQQNEAGQLCCTLHGHYIDDGFALRNIVLGTRVHNEQAGDLFELCVQLLRPHQGDSRRAALRTMSGATIVVDGQRNRNGMQRMINCVASGLNGIATELITDSTVVQQICQTVVQKLMAHTAPEIRACLLRFDGSQWQSIWELLTVYREIVGTVECPHEIDDILAMLDPLHEVSTCLGRFGARTPTINLVYPFRQKLLDVFASALDATTIAVKQKFLASIKSNFVLTDLHRIAVFLDPRFKSLRFFSAEERARIVVMTKVLIGDAGEGQTIEDGDDKRHDEQPTADAASQRQQPAHAYLADYMDENCTAMPSTNEVDAYVRLQPNGTLRVADDDQVLVFWQQRDDMPRLQNLVRQILCIPASCTADACHFSDEAKRVMETRARMRLPELEAAMLLMGNRETFEDGRQ